MILEYNVVGLINIIKRNFRDQCEKLSELAPSIN